MGDAENLLNEIDKRALKNISQNIVYRTSMVVVSVATDYTRANVKVPGDSSEYNLLNKTGEMLLSGDSIIVESNGTSLNNGLIVHKFGTSINSTYEEGIWTPSLTGTSGGVYTMGAGNLGLYTRIGRQITVCATVVWTAQTTPYSGNLMVAGLPFVCGSVRGSGSISAVLNGLGFTSGYTYWQTLVEQSTSYIYIMQANAGYSHTPTVGTSGTIYGLTATYFIQ